MAGILSHCGRYAEAERFCDRAWSIAQVAEDPIRVKVTNLVAWTGDVHAALGLLNTLPEPLREHRFFFRRAELRERAGDDVGARADYERQRMSAGERYGQRSGPRGIALHSQFRLAQLDRREDKTAQATARLVDALAGIDRFVRDFPNAIGVGLGYRALIQGAQGRRAEVMATLAALEEHSRAVARGREESAFLFARGLRKAAAFGWLGDVEQAVVELRAMQTAGYVFGYSLRMDPDLAPLRGDAKFQQLTKEVEARADAVPRPKK